MKNKDFIILCVDDNKANLEILSSILREQEYKLALAKSGKDALKIIESENIDLILLDIMMPGDLDGYETCEILKSNIKTSLIPILFVTARNDVHDIAKGLLMGGNDYITKPYQAVELLARVKTHIKLVYLQKQLRDRVNYLEKSRSELMSWLNGLAKTIQ